MSFTGLYDAKSGIEWRAAQGYAVVDSFLPTKTILAMREEAAAIRRSGVMKPAVRLGYYGVDSKPGELPYNGPLCPYELKWIIFLGMVFLTFSGLGF